MSRSLLRLVNFPLEAANALLRWAWGNELLPRHQAPLPVVSVGNIAMGGTGKTPLVAALAATLLARGARPAILTRGYRRQGKAPLVLRGDPQGRFREAGDEPSLLARMLPQVPVVVDANRFRGAGTALALGATHLLLDDGFQHHRLARQLDLVVVRAADPLGRLSPRREGPWALRAASRVVAVGEPEEQETAAACLRRYHPLPPFPAALRAVGWIREGQRQELQALAGQRVFAFAGIANPERFFRLLSQLGAQLVGTARFADHHAFSPAELAGILAQADRHRALPITTAKDHVRLPQTVADRVAFLEVALVPLAGSFADLLAPLEPV